VEVGGEGDEGGSWGGALAVTEVARRRADVPWSMSERCLAAGFGYDDDEDDTPVTGTRAERNPVLLNVNRETPADGSEPGRSEPEDETRVSPETGLPSFSSQSSRRSSAFPTGPGPFPTQPSAPRDPASLQLLLASIGGRPPTRVDAFRVGTRVIAGSTRREAVVARRASRTPAQRVTGVVSGRAAPSGTRTGRHGTSAASRRPPAPGDSLRQLLRAHRVASGLVCHARRRCGRPRLREGPSRRGNEDRLASEGRRMPLSGDQSREIDDSPVIDGPHLADAERRSYRAGAAPYDAVLRGRGLRAGASG